MKLFEGVRVLIAEGDPLLRKVFGEIFKGRGGEVLTAGDSDAALQFVDEPLDWVVLDPALPGESTESLINRFALGAGPRPGVMVLEKPFTEPGIIRGACDALIAEGKLPHREPRHPVDQKVQLVFSGEQTSCRGRLLNLSVGGFCVEFELERKVLDGEIVTFEAPEDFNGGGVIRWTSAGGHGRAVLAGVEFLAVVAPVKIEQLISTWSK